MSTTNSTDKTTKRDFYNMIIADYTDNNADMVAFAMHEIKLLDNRKAKGGKSKAEAQARADFRAEVIRTIATLYEPMTVTEILGATALGCVCSNQKLSSILNSLVADGLVEKTTEKRKSYFIYTGDTDEAGEEI